jgi:2-C-methyl-D-erythritol 4-phosphate cytidylyltransferase
LPRDVGVVIVAGGDGARLGGQVRKQYREIAGVPMLLRALRPFTEHPDVAQVVIVLPPDDVSHPPEWLRRIAGGLLTLAPGGTERSDSVASGLGALGASCRFVLVHDAARPFVDRQIIDAVLAVAREGYGAVPALPVGDTLKEVTSRDHVVARTVSREGLWRAQTPQGFPRDLLELAHREARAAGVRGTDDAALVERLAAEVRLVPGSEQNLKVTTAEDLALAEILARGG